MVSLPAVSKRSFQKLVTYLRVAGIIDSNGEFNLSKGTLRNIQNKRRVHYEYSPKTVRQAVVAQKGPLMRKFKLDRKELLEVARSAYEVLDKHITKRIRNTRTSVTIFDRNQDILEAPNFETLGRFMTAVRKDIRQEALNEINKSKRNASTARRANAVSVAVTGVDVRYRNKGGDLYKSDIDNGVIVYNQREGSDTPRNKELNDAAKKAEVGIQIGHTYGVGLGNLDAFLEDSDINSFFSMDTKMKLLGIREEIRKIDARIAVDLRIFQNSGADKGSLTVTIAESTSGNQRTGGQIRKLSDEFKALIVRELPEIFAFAQGSPSLLKRYTAAIEELFLKGKVSKKTGTFKKTYKSSGKQKEKIPTYTMGLTANKSRGRAKPRRSSSNIQLLIKMLNDRLERQIQENMGKGGSEQMLNYRTGRFAASAQVTELLSTGRASSIMANVKYLRFPYGVFEKGGKLYKPLRDPAGIFGRSIRQILQEEKVAEFRRVEVTLNG